MKKLYYILIALAVGLSFASCQREEDDLFDKSAAERLNEAVAEYKALLTSSSNGWAMEYYISEKEYGGLIYTAKFDGTKVEMRTEVGFSMNGEPVESLTSYYRVIAEQGVVLTFDTYNAIFHYFSEPNGSSDTDGYASDYEFVFHDVSADKDTIYLRGKKYGNNLKMVRLEKEPQDYIDGANNLDDMMSIPRYSMTVNGKSYAVELDGTFLTRQFTYTPDDSEETVTVPFIATDKGIEFYEPITLNGVTFEVLYLNSSTGEYKSADGLVIVPFPTMQDQLEHALGRYQIYDGCDDFMALNNAITSPSTYTTFYGVFFGENANYPSYDDVETIVGAYWMFDLLGLIYYPYVPGYLSEITYENDVLDFNVLGDADDNSYTYWTRSKAAVDYFMDHRPYTVTKLNDGPVVSEIKLVSTTDSSVWFNCSLESND